jgi:hypothetical protein
MEITDCLSQKKKILGEGGTFVFIPKITFNAYLE